MAARPDEQIVISGTGHRLYFSEAVILGRRIAPTREILGRDARDEPEHDASLVAHSAATILPFSHLNMEKLGVARSPVLS